MAPQSQSWKLDTHILLKLCKSFPDAVLQQNHSFTVGPAFHRGVQALAHSLGEQRDGGGAMDITAGHRGFERRTVHMERPGTEGGENTGVNY